MHDFRIDGVDHDSLNLLERDAFQSFYYRVGYFQMTAHNSHIFPLGGANFGLLVSKAGMRGHPVNRFISLLALSSSAVLAFAITAFGQETKTVRATAIVEDNSGARITFAEGFIVTADKPPVKCLSESGEVRCEIQTDGSATMTIFAPGYEPQQITLEQSRQEALRIVLQRAVQLSITVTFERTRVGQNGKSEVQLSRMDLQETAAPLIDDKLRQTAGFSTFRRNSGRQANPTTQGVSLRGIGASGASRAIVNDEDIAVNDPFGGWVQWNRIIPIAVRSIDVERGGSSGTEGSGAISGAVTIRPRQIGANVFSGELSGGSQRTASGSIFTGVNVREWRITTAGASFQTKGFVPVAPAERGKADSVAGVRYNTFNSRVERRFGDVYLLLKPSYFGEVRTNGTGLQTNRTHSKQLSGGINYFRSQMAIKVNAFAGAQVYDQMFSSVAADRNSETLTRIQRTPATSNGFGTAATYVKSSGFTISLGYELRNVRGASDEIIFSGGGPTTAVGGGGRENTQAGYLTYRMIRDRIIFGGALRYDRWNNHRGLSVSKTFVTDAVTTSAFAPRTDHKLSPRLSASVRISNPLFFFGSFSQSFRAPTLNELYRSFRVGNIVTVANNNLAAERSTEYEGGISYRADTFGVRGSYFHTSIRDTVANVTLSTAPSLITRQRRNAGRTVSRGVEAEFETKIDKFTFSAGYLFADSAIREFSSNTTLVGKRIVQVPAHQSTFQIRYGTKNWTFSSQMRASSTQFDDDLNTLRLEPYFQADGFVSYKIGEKISTFAAIENIFNSRYSTAKTPVRSVSGPISVRVGIRFGNE